MGEPRDVTNDIKCSVIVDAPLVPSGIQPFAGLLPRAPLKSNPRPGGPKAHWHAAVWLLDGAYQREKSRALCVTGYPNMSS